MIYSTHITSGQDPDSPRLQSAGACSQLMGRSTHVAPLTSPSSALGISEDGFRIAKAGSNAGTMYGRGCYLGESCTKADEFRRRDLLERLSVF